MAETDLIAETNRLLRQLIEADAEERQRSKESMERLTTMRERLESRRGEERKARSQKEGLPEDDSEENQESRRKEAHRRSQENIEVSREREERYREDLLGELRLQSDLLRQIAERLDR